MFEAIVSTLIFSGVMVAFATTACFIATRIIEEDINKELMTAKEVDDMEKDYVYLNDGTPVEYNEDDQE